MDVRPFAWNHQQFKVVYTREKAWYILALDIFSERDEFSFVTMGSCRLQRSRSAQTSLLYRLVTRPLSLSVCAVINSQIGLGDVTGIDYT